MLRRAIPTTLVLLAGCGGHRAPPAVTTPVRAGTAADASSHLPPAPILADALVLPPAPALDTLVPAAELAAESRLAADSVADEAVLEALEEARPADDHSDESLEPIPVSWDIDVDTYNSHDRVQYYLDFFQGPGRERMGIWLSRMPRYERMIRARLQERGLPGDLVYLALIESGFSNSATSRAKAVGMWQFMKATARGYGLRVDSWVDERRDPYRATDAAVRHLKQLSDRFGSLYLAAAAYNAGAGKVSRGVRRLREDDTDSINSDATFFRLYDTRLLHRETKDYVPKLIAAARIAKEPGRYGFDAGITGSPGSQLWLGAPYDSLRVPTMTGLDVIARLADTTVAAIRELNPQYLRLATPPGVPSTVRVPPGRGATTEAAYAALPPPRRITFLEHVVARGETMGGIAHRYGVSTRIVTESNPRLAAGRLRPGQRVIVPTGGALSTSVARRVANPMTPAAGSPTGLHRVRRGETLSGLASEYGVSVGQLKRWNGLGSDALQAGRRLRVAAPPTTRLKPRTRLTSSGARAGATVLPTTSASAAGPRVHTVRRGETLTDLARRYGVTVETLRNANHISAGDRLREGATLRIPG